jgi:hypothetical protein
MEPEGSLLRSQKPIIGPYIELIESSPLTHILFLWYPFLIFSSDLPHRLPNCIFHSSFPTEIVYAFLLPHACYMPRLLNNPWFGYPGDE